MVVLEVVPGQENTTRFFFFFLGGANRGAERGRSAGGECIVLFTYGITVHTEYTLLRSTEYIVCTVICTL